MEVCLDTVTTADDAGSSRKIKIRDPSFHLLSRAVMMVMLQLFVLFLFQQGTVDIMTTANYFGANDLI